MFRKLVKNRKAQNTAEYALLIALVVAAVIAMQSYAQRALQGRIRDAAVFLQTESSAIGTTKQYESYVDDLAYNVERQTDETQLLGVNQVEMLTTTNRIREKGGRTTSTYYNIGTNNI